MEVYLEQTTHLFACLILQLPPPPQIELVVDKPHLMGVLRRPIVRIRRKCLFCLENPQISLTLNPSSSSSSSTLRSGNRHHQRPPARRCRPGEKTAPASKTTRPRCGARRRWPSSKSPPRRTRNRRVRWPVRCPGATAGVGRPCRTASGAAVSCFCLPTFDVCSCT